MSVDLGDLAVTRVESSLEGFSTAHYYIDGTTLHISYSQIQNINVAADAAILTLVLESTDIDGQSISLSDRGLSAELYIVDSDSPSVKVQTIDIQNRDTEGNEIIDDFRVLQNQPNPFTGSTEIAFYSSKEDFGKINVTDVMGRTILSQSINASAGWNTIEISSDDLAGNGVYYYQIELSTKSAVKSMILVE